MPTLQFKGKTFVQNHHLTVKYHKIIPDKEKSLTNKVSLHDNLIIHGDNLIALKALLPTFAGKVKCIYIDPPYNTGNEKWEYNDNVNSPMMQEWLGKVVDKDDLTGHDKWLCMIMPRLKLLRELLREDGVIFVSCDDNEQHRLRMLMDEVFGEDNFLAQVIWQKVYSPRMDAEEFSVDHDYITVYRKSGDFSVNRLSFKQNLNQFNNMDENGNRYRRRSLRKEGKNSRREDRPNLYYALPAPDGTEVYPVRSDGSEGCWRWSSDKYATEFQKGMVEWIKDEENGWQVYVKQFYNVNATKPPSTFWPYTDFGHNHEAVEEIRSLFGNPVFNSPKPTKLIKQILQLATDSDEECIVLDSFAGSGTTGQAVLQFNKENGTHHKFILVEMEDYANHITAERVRRVIQGVPDARDENLREGLGGTFSFFRLGDPIEMETLLQGDDLPAYEDLARFVFYTATGEEFDPSKMDESRYFIGESKEYQVYLLYKPDMTFLKSTALNLEFAEDLGPHGNKKRLVFAPMNFMDTEYLIRYRIEFSQLPFEIYKFKG